MRKSERWRRTFNLAIRQPGACVDALITFVPCLVSACNYASTLASHSHEVRDDHRRQQYCDYRH